MSVKLNFLRWVLIIPVAIAVWYACLIFGLLAFFVVEHFLRVYFCPPELIISGACVAAWVGIVQDVFIVFFAALSAIFIIISVALLAPYKKNAVAITSFIMGSCVAFFMAYHTKAWFVFVAVVLAGAISTSCVVVKFKKTVS